MTREEFIKQLDEYGYSYEIEGDKIIVTHTKSTGFGHIHLDDLTSLPPGVVFRNEGEVYLDDLSSLPSSVEFNNGGDVHLKLLKTISSSVEFNNGGDVRSLIGGWIGGWQCNWQGNIEGIDSKRLLNVMIKQGVFER